MAVDDNKKHHFNPVAKSQWKDVWDKIITDTCPIKVWIKDNEKEAKEFSIKSYHFENNQIVINQKSNLINLFDTTKDLANKLILIKINWANLQFFGSGIFSTTSTKDEFTIALSASFFQCQQRSFLRLSQNSGVAIKMKYLEDVYDLFDISGGGLSLFLSNTKSAMFTKGQEIQNLKVKIGEEQFNLPKAQIVFVSTEDNLQTKIAMKFLDLTEDMQIGLLRKINIEARGAIVLSHLKEQKNKAS
jgi:hypothetical protein